MDFNDKIRIIDEAPGDFQNLVEKSQSEIFKKFSKILNKLELDENGNVKLSLKNLSLIEPFSDDLEAIINNSSYSKAVKEFAKQMDAVKDLTDEFFVGIDEAPNEVQDKLYQQIRDREINKLSIDAVKNNVESFKSILQDSIAQSDNFTNLIGNIQDNIMGSAEVEGKLASYAKTYAKDMFSNTERTYTTVLSDAAGIEFYSYSGGKQDTTREFCKERVNKIFHYKEIQKWAKLSWDGKARDTDKKTIFTKLGGYNCNHSLIPVGINDVPISVLKRNIEAGNIKKEDLPERIKKRL